MAPNTQPPTDPDLREIVREELEQMLAEADINLDDLPQREGTTRRDVLKAAGLAGAAGLTGAGGMTAATEPAKAGSSSAGNWGTKDNPGDFYSEDHYAVDQAAGGLTTPPTGFLNFGFESGTPRYLDAAGNVRDLTPFTDGDGDGVYTLPNAGDGIGVGSIDTNEIQLGSSRTIYLSGYADVDAAFTDLGVGETLIWDKTNVSPSSWHIPPKGSTIRGVPSTSPHIVYPSDTAAGFNLDGDQTGTTIEDMWINGNRSTFTSGGRGIFSFDLRGSNITIRNNRIDDVYLDGVNLQATAGNTAKNLRIEGNVFGNNRQHGVFVGIDTDNNGATLIDGLHVRDNEVRDTDNAIGLTCSAYDAHGDIKNAHFIGNTVVNAANESIVTEGTSLRNVVMNNNTTEGGKGIGVSAGSNEVTIVGNTVKGSRLHGIRIWNSTDKGQATVSGNTVLAPSNNGVFLELAHGSIVTGNRVTNAGAYGIREGADADYNNVDGNLLWFPTNAGVSLQGVNSVATDNLVR